MSQPQSRSSRPLPETVVDVEVAQVFASAVTVVELLESSLVAAVESLLLTLGIPDAASVTVHTAQSDASADGPVAIRLNGHRVRYSHDLSSTLSHHLGSAPEDVHKDPDRAVEYLTLLTVEAIKARAALLLGGQQLEWYRHTLRTAGAQAAAESPYLERALQRALGLSSSIADIEAVGEALADSSNADEPEVLESVIQAVRQRDIEIRLPFGYLRQLTDNGEWTGEFKTLRTSLVQELGAPVPPFRFVFDEGLSPQDDDAPPSFCFRFNALTTPPIRGLALDEILVNETPKKLEASGIQGAATINPTNGWLATIVKSGHRQTLEASRQTFWDARQFIILCLGEAIRRRCALFLDRSVVEDLILNLRRDAPRLVEWVSGLLSTAEITAVLRELLDAQVPIGNVRKICDLLVDAERETGLAERVARVRAGLRREITNRLSRATSVLPAYLLDPPVVDLLERASTSGLSEHDETAITDAVRSELSPLPRVTPPAIIATPNGRAPLLALLRDVFPRVHVTTFDEIAPDVNVQPIARISV
jgi:flagellar biosynthesis component FlhA